MGISSIASIGSVLSGFSRWSMLAWRGSGPDTTVRTTGR
jgi:hypothetical protein